MVGLGVDMPTSPTSSPTTTSARPRCYGRCAAALRAAAWCSPAAWSSTAKAATRCAEHGARARPPRAPSDLDGGRFEPRARSAARRSTPRPVAEDAPLRPAQRLRGHQAPPGAPLLRVRARDRRAGHRAALPQRLRAADAARHALRGRGRDLPQRARGAARRRGCSRTAASCATSCTCATSPQPTCARSPRRARRSGALNVASGTPRSVLEMADALAAARSGPRRTATRDHRRSGGPAMSVTCSHRAERAAAALGFRAEEEFARMGNSPALRCERWRSERTMNSRRHIRFAAHR